MSNKEKIFELNKKTKRAINKTIYYPINIIN